MSSSWDEVKARRNQPTERSTMSESTRALIYRGLVGTVPLAVGYGLISDQLAPLWIGAIAGWLGAGLAAKNTSR